MSEFLSPKGINKPDEVISEYLQEWKEAGIILKGTRAVRKNAKLFLPMPMGMPPEAYKSYVLNVTFSPLSAKALELLMGLMFYKKGKEVIPKGKEDIATTITSSGLNLEALAKQMAWDYCITGYGCLVTDYPPAPPGISQAEAIATGVRPFLAHYKGASILQVPDVAVINNRQRVTRLRLLDDPRTVRELVLIDGVYTIVMHRLLNGAWTITDTIVPTKNGKPLDEIPVEMITTQPDLTPDPAPLRNSIEFNIDHYRKMANYDTMLTVSTIRVWKIAGGDMDENYNVYPGALWKFRDKDVSVELIGVGDNSLAELREAVIDIETKHALFTSRSIEPSKTAVESADTIAVRQAGNNASIGNVARIISTAMNGGCEWLCWWDSPVDDMAKIDKMTYTINADYNSLPLTAQDRAQMITEQAAGLYSRATHIALLQNAGCLPENFDPVADAERMAEEVADRPPIDTPRPSFASNQPEE